MDRRSLIKTFWAASLLLVGAAQAKALPYLTKDKRDVINTTMRQGVENALTQAMFEVNDDETRSEVAAIVDAFALHLKESGVIENYEIVCDETNNPPDYVESNRLEVYASLRDGNMDLIYMIIGVAGTEGIDVKTIEYWKRS